MLIRRAESRDLEAMLGLYVQLSAGNASTAIEAAAPAFAEMLADDRMTVLVAEDEDGQMVGTATVVVVPNMTHGGRPWAQLENMVVDESVRGRGVGRLVMDECLRRAWEAGCYKLQLQSAEEREGAHRFYQSMGFRASSVGFRLYRE